MKRIFRLLISSSLILTSISDIAFSQEKSSYLINPVSLSQYLSDVIKGNLGYIAGQLNISITEAELNASRALPDPEISVAYSNNEDKTLQMGQSLETVMSYPVNTGNKRSAGISMARSRHELSQLLADSYFQNLRADAALNYFTGVKTQKIHQLQKEIYIQLSELARADSIRFITGEGTELDALQSSLEARAQLSEVYQSNTDLTNALLNMMLFKGKEFADTIVFPSDDFLYRKREFSLDSLLISASNNRADLMAAIKNNEVSDRNLRLLKTTRAFEFNLEAGYSYNSVVRNEIAPAPEYNGFSAGISFPLKFSNLNRGSLKAAELAMKQSHILYDEIRLQIATEVIQSYNDFITQKMKVEHYNLGLIRDAERILQGRIYSYQHGESGLLDVLNAQRTYIDLQLNYINTLFDYTKSLVEIERSAGIWDLTQ